MIERLFQKGAIPTLEKGISFTAQRHKVLANNIANADTPYYKARDLAVGEFQETLRRTIDDRYEHPVGIFDWKGPAHLRENALGGVDARVERVRRGRELSQRGILRHDKNNVSVEEEMAKMSKNSMMHSAMIDLLRKQFRMIDGALAERVEG